MHVKTLKCLRVSRQLISNTRPEPRFDDKSAYMGASGRVWTFKFLHACKINGLQNVMSKYFWARRHLLARKYLKLLLILIKCLKC